jgi:hypothetical protein
LKSTTDELNKVETKDPTKKAEQMLGFFCLFFSTRKVETPGNGDDKGGQSR